LHSATGANVTSLSAVFRPALRVHPIFISIGDGEHFLGDKAAGKLSSSSSQVALIKQFKKYVELYLQPKMDLREIGWDEVDWIDMAQDRDQWRALVNKVLNLRIP
jgi:hypothetical protein